MASTTTTNPPQTILTEQEFENLTSNYYLFKYTFTKGY